jgi:KDO2-lipid IV(A) lauroyltransferase
MHIAIASSSAMYEHAHSFRPNFLSSERTYRLADDGLECVNGGATQLTPYRDIVEIQEYKDKVRGPSSANQSRRFDYELRCRDGQKIVLKSKHSVGLLVAEDRSSSCNSLVGELSKRVAEANPEAKFSKTLRWVYKLDIAVQGVRDWIGFYLLKMLRWIDFDRGMDFAAAVMRRVGPYLRGHRTARANLTAAYPEKSPAEVEQILIGMWDNLARLAVEYINLDSLCKDDPCRDSSRVFFAPGTLEKIIRMRDDGKPAVLFTAHLANYEVGAITSTRQGLDMGVLYRRPNVGPIAEHIVKMRADSMGHIIAAGPDSVWRIREALKHGKHVAMLLDQHFAQGVEVSFFGRRCMANPMAARFAQLFNCPVYGARSIRLPGNRIRFEFTDELNLPRNPNGRIDVQAATQMMTSMIEDWVREYPEQWFWLHRRWR